jgi:PAS domain S-box-containing protein
MLIMASPSACKLLLYNDITEVVGRHNSSFWKYPDQRDAFLIEMQRNGEVRDYELVLQRSDGSPIIVSTTSTYYYDRSGNRVGTHGIFHDITERKKTEDALKQSEERLRRAELVAGTGNWEIDLSSGVVYSSEGARQIYGIQGETSTLAEIKVIPLPEYRPVLDKAMKDLVENNIPYNIDFKIRRSTDGKTIDIHSVATYVANSRMVFGIIQDVTEQRVMRDMIIQSEKMMSVGGLAAGMAHEINNPLGGILQNAQVITRRLTSDSRANADAAQSAGCTIQAINRFMESRGILSCLGNIRESGERAAHIVKNMLEFSRGTESANTRASINALLDKSIDLCSSDFDLRRNYDFKNIAIRKEYIPDIPEIRCFPTQLQQVFVNILGNAAHALTDVLSPRIILRTFSRGDCVHIEIEDNGRGMDEETIRKVFEPFFTTKIVGEGTGLGLSVSYFIITNNHHGSIHVKSSVGKGTCFMIALPAAPDTAGGRMEQDLGIARAQ